MTAEAVLIIAIFAMALFIFSAVRCWVDNFYLCFGVAALILVVWISCLKSCSLTSGAFDVIKSSQPLDTK